MLDIKLLENNFDDIVDKLTKRNVNKDTLTTLKQNITTSKNIQKELESLRANQNTLSKQFGEYMAKKSPIDELKKKLSINKENILEVSKKQSLLQEQIQAILQTIPNIQDKDAPDGIDENDNIEIKKILIPRNFDFEPLEHYTLAEKNGWIDFERGVKIAKSRFSALIGDGAKLNRALINYMIDFNSDKGFTETRLPFMANSQSLYASGQFPKFKDDVYSIKDEDLYLIPTSEVTLINLHRDEILQEETLPRRFNSYSPCFRKEAGSAGMDTRGMIRQHQFEKVEIVSLCHPDESKNELEFMLNCASSLLESLELPHRIMHLCVGDMGFSASSTFDIEVWLPGQKKYREISSISNTKDFQSRRAKIRYKNKNGKNNFVHTLNGSSLAIGRTIVAIMENFQNLDGSIDIPKVLKPYM